MLCHVSNIEEEVVVIRNRWTPKKKYMRERDCVCVRENVCVRRCVCVCVCVRERDNMCVRRHLVCSPEQLLSIPDLANLGTLFKSSRPVELTESETEYYVKCVKHTFLRYVVFQVCFRPPTFVALPW